MKVKPFYIRITDDMTPQMVQDAFDKCVDAGVEPNDAIGGVKRKHDSYRYYDDVASWSFFGVCGADGTYLGSVIDSFDGDPIEITLDRLDAHLGIADGEEWRNGDECEHGHHNYSGANKMTYIGAHPFVSWKHVCLSELKGLIIVDSVWLRKPETTQQREERERLEAIETMCNEVDKLPHGEAFAAMAMLYDLGYRKEK